MRFLKRQLKRDNDSQEAALLDDYIEWAEDEKTALAISDAENPKFAPIERAHDGYQKNAPSLYQSRKNIGYTLRTQAKHALQQLLSKYNTHKSDLAKNLVYNSKAPKFSK